MAKIKEITDAIEPGVPFNVRSVLNFHGIEKDTNLRAQLSRYLEKGLLDRAGRGYYTATQSQIDAIGSGGRWGAIQQAENVKFTQRFCWGVGKIIGKPGDTVSMLPPV